MRQICILFVMFVGLCFTTPIKAQSPQVDGKIHIYYFDNKLFSFDKNEKFSVVNQLARNATGDARKQKRNDAYYYQGKASRFDKDKNLVGISTEIWIHLNDDGTVFFIEQKATCVGASEASVQSVMETIMDEIVNRTENGPTKYNEDSYEYENSKETFEVSIGGINFNGSRYEGVMHWVEFVK